jgi:hypothetical protein
VAALRAEAERTSGDVAAVERRALGPLMDDELPDFDRMDDERRRSALMDLIRAEAGDLQVRGCPMDDVVQLNAVLLTELTRADYRWAKAYTLGTSLERLTMHVEPWRRDILPQRMRELSRRVTDLKSCFQPYAADAVASTLSDWATRVERSSATPSAADRQDLCRQGQIWRALLSGEKLATDNLQVRDYLSGAEHVASALWVLVCRTFGGARVLLGVTLAVGVITLSVAVVLGVRGQLGFALGALSLGLGWVGITTASVGATARRAVGFVEKELWQAALSAAIASSIDVAGNDTADSSAVHRLRGR